MTYCDTCGWNDYQTAVDSEAEARGEQINTTHFHYGEEGIPTCSGCTGRDPKCTQCRFPYFGTVERWRRET